MYSRYFLNVPKGIKRREEYGIYEAKMVATQGILGVVTLVEETSGFHMTCAIHGSGGRVAL